MPALLTRRPARATALAVAFAAALFGWAAVTRAARAESPGSVLTLVDQAAGVSYAVASDGPARAAMGAGRRAYLIDIAADGAATVRGRTPFLPATVRAILFDGTRLFVAPEGGGIHVFDIADPSTPTEIGVIPVTHEVHEMVLHDGNLVTAEFGEGVGIYDVSGDLPTAPLAVEHTHRAVTGIALQDDRVFAAYATEGLGIIDISDPTTPRFLGQAEMPMRGKAESITVAGDIALLAVYSALGVYDVADPSAPKLVATISNGTSILTAAVQGKVLYVGHGADGVGVYDMATPAKPTLLRTLPTLNAVVRLRRIDTRLYVVDWLAGVTMYDLATPDAPSKVGAFEDIAGYPFGLDVANGHVFSGLAHDRLAVFDTATMAEVASQPLPVAAQDVNVDIEGDRLAAGDLNTGLTLFDIADPRAPRQLAYAADAVVRDLVLLDDTHAVATGGGKGMTLWDFADPTRPQRTMRAGTPAFMWGLTADATNVLVSDRENGLLLYGTRPEVTWPVEGKTTLGPEKAEARDIAFLDGDTVAVAADAGGLYVVDVRDRAAPKVLGKVNTRFEPLAIAVHDNLVFAGGRNLGLAVYDVADRTKPRFVGRYDLLAGVNALAWSGDRLYATASAEGILVFEVGTIPPVGTEVKESASISPDALPTAAGDGASVPSVVQRAPESPLVRNRTWVAVVGGLALALAVVAAGRWALHRLRRAEPS